MLKEGLEIKDYTLKQFLGKGSFGEVWLAEKKIEIADKKVPFALKFISDNTHGISDYSSVKREINTWIDASGNKNIISVQDGFLYENLFVIVSEYANNGSLRQWLREHGGKSPGLEKTVEIMCGILDGLTHLHAQNIIHRDLKPENILLKGDVPCIADFGVSRIVATASLELSSGTNTAGSPMYMSPESFERIKPSPQIDIWSAGVMLFEMLSGKTPYSSDTIPGLIYEIVTKEPRSLPADIPESFHRVVKKALAKDISDRFLSAKEMREALMRALYSQHHSPAASAETMFFAEYGEKHPANGKLGADLLKTLPMSKELSVVQPGQDKKGNKKMLAWIGLGAVVVLAGAVGIFTLKQSSADVNSNQRNNSISNQAAVVETNINTNANAASNEVIVQPQNIEKPIEKEKIQPKQRVTTKAETAPKKDAPRRTQQTKKKVTLDDLIN